MRAYSAPHELGSCSHAQVPAAHAPGAPAGVAPAVRLLGDPDQPVVDPGAPDGAAGRTHASQPGCSYLAVPAQWALAGPARRPARQHRCGNRRPPPAAQLQPHGAGRRPTGDHHQGDHRRAGQHVSGQSSAAGCGGLAGSGLRRHAAAHNARTSVAVGSWQRHHADARAAAGRRRGRHADGRGPAVLGAPARRGLLPGRIRSAGGCASAPARATAHHPRRRLRRASTASRWSRSAPCRTGM